MIADAQVLLRHTRIFRSHHDRYRSFILHRRIILRRFLAGGKYLHPALLQETDRLVDTLLLTNRQYMQGAGRGLDRVGVYRNASFCRNHNRIDSRTLAGTGNSAEITHVRNPIQQYDERIFSLLIHKRNDIFQALVGNRRHKSDHPLMILSSQTIQAFSRNTLYRYLTASQYLK